MNVWLDPLESYENNVKEDYVFRGCQISLRSRVIRNKNNFSKRDYIISKNGIVSILTKFVR